MSPEIQSLRRDIEQRMGVALQSPADFEHLIQQIWDKQHSVLSLSTIKRIWGYVQSNSAPRLSTLNTLSQFLDYADWNACQQLQNLWESQAQVRDSLANCYADNTDLKYRCVEIWAQEFGTRVMQIDAQVKQTKPLQ